MIELFIDQSGHFNQQVVLLCYFHVLEFFRHFNKQEEWTTLQFLKWMPLLTIT